MRMIFRRDGLARSFFTVSLAAEKNYPRNHLSLTDLSASSQEMEDYEERGG
jgi:hypothetical protein